MTETVTIVGKVIRKRINAGSKSERNAVVIVGPNRELTLRRQGKSAYTDTSLEGLVGKSLRATGKVSAGQLIMRDFELIDED